MKITFRLILFLMAAATLSVSGFAWLQIRRETRRLEGDLQNRARVLANSLQDLVEGRLNAGRADELRVLVDRYGGEGRLLGLAVYSNKGEVLAISRELPSYFKLIPERAASAIRTGAQDAFFLTQGESRWHLEVRPVRQGDGIGGVMALVHDTAYIGFRRIGMLKQNLQQWGLLVALISLTALLFLRFWLVAPLARTIDWMRRLRMGEISFEREKELPNAGIFRPLTQEVSRLAGALSAAREAAEEEARLRYAGESRWTPERLKEHVRTVLGERQVLVIANREPYMHVHQGRQIQCIVPASGLVTAVEPILRACGGTWVGSGAGDADRETADEKGRLPVPPEAPVYTLRRVWLEKAEENGFYYGFSNEGLWPLCHIAHTRPTFRIEDWTQYQRVNEKFAEAALEEMAGTEEPCILIQDYHFALLPRLIKEKRPDARIALFWHIPWPNPEAFGICPWARELLHGMLGADLLGFHIQFHCNNFLDTVDRMLESRIDWERFAVNRAGHRTLVKPFPISISEQRPAQESEAFSSEQLKETILRELGIQAARLGVGVDRIDYTKGIAERFRGVERFLEKYPKFQGEFTFVELGAPSRTLIKRYHDLIEELDTEAERINRRFQTRNWKPILFIKKHHSHEEINRFYRASDLCLVTSLHDGMNLVAKEYVSAREDRRGSLILSRFAGASREFRDAFLVNPYDTDQMAEAIYRAMMLTPEEQADRMSRMREILEENNIYRWAADMISELARLRPSSAASTSLPAS